MKKDSSRRRTGPRSGSTARAEARVPRLALWLAALLALLAPRVAGAPQESGAPPPAAEAAGDQQPSAGHPSPRAAMEAFLSGMVDADLGRALGAFDLASRPAGWRGPGAEELVRDLYETLNRTEFVRLERLPGEGWSRPTHVWRAHPHGHPEIPVELRFEKGPGGWLITWSSLAAAADLRASVRGLPVVEDLLDSLGLLEGARYRLRAALPEVFLRRAFLIETWQWLGLVVLLFVAVVFDRVVRAVVSRVVRRLTRGEWLDAGTLTSFERPAGLFGGAVLFELLLGVLGLDLGIRHVLGLAAGLVGTVAGVWASFRLVDVLCDYLKSRASRTPYKFDDMLVPLVRRTLKLFVVVVGLVVLASRWTEDLWGIVAGLGLGSIALGFAAKDSIENLFGTFTVLMDKPFAIGDWIVVDSIEGTVEEVGFRSTRIRTFYDSSVSVPNRTFISTPIDNLGRRRYRRIKTMLSLTYATPPEKVEAFCEGIRQLLRGHPYTRKDAYHVYLNQFAASSLDVLLYAFVEAPDWATELRERHRLFADVLRLAERLGVSFAFPTQTVHLGRHAPEEHGDRPPDDPEGARLGRRAADEVLAASLAGIGGPGAVPPPVEIAREPVKEDPAKDEQGSGRR